MSDEEWDRQKARIAMAREREVKAFARLIGMEHNLQASEWLLRVDERMRSLEGSTGTAMQIGPDELETSMPNLLEHVLCISHKGQVCEVCGKHMKSESEKA